MDLFKEVSNAQSFLNKHCYPHYSRCNNPTGLWGYYHSLSGNFTSLLFQQLLAVRNNRLQRLCPGVPLVIGLDHRPRRMLRTRPRKHLVDCHAVLVPLLPVAPVLVRDLPLL